VTSTALPTCRREVRIFLYHLAVYVGLNVLVKQNCPQNNRKVSYQVCSENRGICKENVREQIATENPIVGGRGNRNEGKNQRKADG
jgi:sulfur relay (sulfurtransferase) complex TusBCD TusD component (DsrE family)